MLADVPTIMSGEVGVVAPVNPAQAAQHISILLLEGDKQPSAARCSRSPKTAFVAVHPWKRRSISSASVSPSAAAPTVLMPSERTSLCVTAPSCSAYAAAWPATHAAVRQGQCATAVAMMLLCLSAGSGPSVRDAARSAFRVGCEPGTLVVHRGMLTDDSCYFQCDPLRLSRPSMCPFSSRFTRAPCAAGCWLRQRRTVRLVHAPLCA